MNSPTLLTIAIPTFNRPNELKNTLFHLLPQLNEQCFLRIIDNYSDIPVESYIQPLLDNYPLVQYEIIRNQVNIGADGNIIRCFELCETIWLWILGDDDEITSQAIKTILEDVNLFSEAINLNYYSPTIFHPRREFIKKAYGRVQFLENIDFFGASIFISANIYNAKKVQNHWLANHNTYSCASHWLIVFYSLNNSEETIQSNKIICYNPHTNKGNIYSSMNLTIANGFATLLDLRLSKMEKNIIIQKLVGVTEKWITFESIVKCLLVEYFRSRKEIDIKFLVKRYYKIFYKYLGYKYTFKFCAYYLFIVISPSLLFLLIRFLLLRKKGIDIKNFIY